METETEKAQAADAQIANIAANPTTVVPPGSVTVTNTPTTKPQGDWMLGTEPQQYDITVKSDGGKAIGGGVGIGNREGDLQKPVDPNDASKGTAAANQTITLDKATAVPQPKLDKIPVVEKEEIEGPNGTHAGYETRSGSSSGSSSGFDAKLGKVGGDGKPIEVTGPNGYAQTGASAKANAGIAGKAEDEYGSIEGKADADASAQIGASAEYGIDQDGAHASAAAGASAEAKVSASADYKTPALQVDDDTAVDAGIGVNGEAGVL
jgi:hypothetical protein